MLIDTHAHVNFKAFENDAQEVIERALNANVTIINVGTQIDTSKKAVKLAEQNKELFAVIGLHPVHTYPQHLDEEESSFNTREEEFNTLEYESLAKSPKVVGIGECGLDYYRLPEVLSNELRVKKEIKQMQKVAFVAQIQLAKELNKALVIHCRPSVNTQDAYEDILQILDQEFGKSKISNPNSQIRFEIHSFTGSPEIVQEFLKRGAYVGLNGIITFDRSGNMEKVINVLPMERIVLETDCPYLTPVPHRGKKNEPAYVRFVAEHVARLKGLNIEEVKMQTTKNTQALFVF